MAIIVRTKAVLASFLFVLGIVNKLLQARKPENFVVIMYHRVLPRSFAIVKQAGMYVEPMTLSSHINFLKKYFSIESFTRVFSGKKNSRPQCVLTFDDGWYDFYQYAYPILERHRVASTVFLSTNYIGTSEWFWTDKLLYLISQKGKFGSGFKPSKSSGNPLIRQIEESRIRTESGVERAISLLKKHDHSEIENVISELCQRWGVKGPSQERAFLTWEEVKELSNSKFVSFGSHSASHRILTHLSDSEVWNELIQSKSKLIDQAVVDPSFIPFCYPNGDYNQTLMKLLSEAGYALAVTSEKGWNDDQIDPFRLRRIGVHEDIARTKAMFACRIASLL